MKIFSGLGDLPRGSASEEITPGCLVLEGGAWRGLYTQGALDALMENGINFQTTIGISAGAMSGIGYVAGAIGWTARINLTYRQDPDYCGIGAMLRDHGVTGFSFLFDDVMQEYPIDEARFNDPARRFLCGATNCETGKLTYFEKGRCEDILQAVAASATVPYVSRPVMIDDVPYLDGGCSINIPYHWAMRRRFANVMVIRTRDRHFRVDPEKTHDALVLALYHRYPNLVRAMHNNPKNYNRLLDEIEADRDSGRTFVLTPEDPIEMGRFESDMEVLGDLYYRGYNEMQERIPSLRRYLERSAQRQEQLGESAQEQALASPETEEQEEGA